MILVDTDVMVDIVRRHAPALAWLDSLGAERIGLPGLVAMELLQGGPQQGITATDRKLLASLHAILAQPGGLWASL